MSYLVLARKWRPKTFSELVGQDHVKRALINALDQDRVHHAFLFTGTRGVGKTTIARIFAKALNCEQGVTSEPCGTCSTCIDVDNGRFLDLIEVDAASRTGVDDTRELLENVQFAPTSGRYKVYLIDEVHMFSKSSFNALLKTLEEPPPHVKFLFATTDPKKVPVTVLSRCLQFHLRSLPVEQIANHLRRIVDSESDISADESATLKLALAADGSMRDALSLLDQAIGHGAGSVTDECVNAMLGSIDQDFVFALFDALIQQNAAKMLDIVEEISTSTPDYHAVLDALIQLLHDIALVQAVESSNLDDARFGTAIQSLAQRCSREDIQLYYQIGILGRRDLPLAPSARSGFEMTLLRMLAFQPDFGTSSRTQSLPPSDQPKPVADTNTLGPTKPRSQDSSVAQTKSSSDQGDDWPTLIASLGLSGMPKQLADNCALTERQDTSITLTLAEAHRFLLTDKSRQQLEQALKSQFGDTVRLTITIVNHDQRTPAMLASQQRADRQKAAEQSIQQDPVVQKMQTMFDAKIEPGSIRPVD